MKMTLLVWVVGSLAGPFVAAAGCGSGSSAGEQKPAPAPRGDAANAAPADASPADATSADATSADATLDAAAIAATSGAAASSAALPKCSDGDIFAGARISAHEARFCVGDATRKDTQRSCWRVDLTAAAAKKEGAISAIAELGPEGVSGEVSVASAFDERAAGGAKPASAWSVTLDDGVQVCGPDGCAPFALQPAVNPDDERTAVIAASISESGARLAVSRGEETVSPLVLEVYDRVSGKKLGATKAKAPCAFVGAFAGESAVFTEWPCANEGGDHLVMSPAGKQVARIAGMFSQNAPRLRVEGDRWAFSSYDVIALYDVVRGKRLAVLPNPEANLGAAHGQLFVLDGRRVELTVVDSSGKKRSVTRAPTCRYEWEAEALGPLALQMPTQQVLKLRGEPAKRTKMDLARMWALTWTYDDGVVLGIEASGADPNSDRPMLPFIVVSATITAPSALRTKAGIGVGSSRAELMAAYGTHVVASRSSESEIFVGNDAQHDQDGLVFELGKDDKVAKISLGRVDWE